jgi:hypothetical protein
MSPHHHSFTARITLTMLSKLVCIAALATFTFAQNDRDALELKDAVSRTLT